MKTHFGFWWPCLPHARMDSPMGIVLQCMVFGYQEFLRSFVGPIADTRGDPSLYHREEFRGVWLAFYDAAWQMCRRGILRPRMNCPEGQGSGWGPPGDGFALTTAGREWLQHAAEAYCPTEPGRYVKTLEKPGRLLGDGFLQRAGEAASSHLSGNYLACCAMCGAAAESVLLAIAICKTEDEAKVLDAYGQRDGRRKVMRMIFDNPCLATLGSRFEPRLNLVSAHQRTKIVAADADRIPHGRRRPRVDRDG